MEEKIYENSTPTQQIKMRSDSRRVGKSKKTEARSMNLTIEPSFVDLIFGEIYGYTQEKFQNKTVWSDKRIKMMSMINRIVGGFNMTKYFNWESIKEHQLVQLGDSNCSVKYGLLTNRY